MVRLVTAVGCMLALTTGAASAGAQQDLQPGNRVNAKRVIEDFDFNYVDDVLRLDTLRVKLVVFKRNSEADISSAHLALFKKWVKSGGVGYFTLEAVQGSLARKLDLVDPYHTSVWKESGASFDSGQGTGELFVKGVLPGLVIHDHAITKGVSQLYVCGPPIERGGRDEVRFFVPKRYRVVPILSAGPLCEPSGIRLGQECPRRADLVDLIVAIEDGQGLIIFDGTGLMAGLNAFRGNAYDWPKMYANLLEYGIASAPRDAARGWMGLFLKPVDSDQAPLVGLSGPRGAAVAGVAPNGPAARAGLQQGDVILTVGGEDIAAPSDASRAVSRNPPGTQLRVEFFRDGNKQTLLITLAALPE